MRNRRNYPSMMALVLVACFAGCNKSDDNKMGIPGVIPTSPLSIQSPVSLGAIDGATISRSWHIPRSPIRARPA
jgi:hypothetical protein